MTNFYGTLSDDIMHGAKSSDLIWAAYGNDVVYGRKGNDQISDTFVADTPHKLQDNDQYHGGAGNDEIRSLFGRDLLLGGAGHDHFIIQNESSVSASGGADTDRADIWLDAGYDILLKHRDQHGDLDHIVISSHDQIFDLRNIEQVHIHDM